MYMSGPPEFPAAVVCDNTATSEKHGDDKVRKSFSGSRPNYFEYFSIQNEIPVCSEFIKVNINFLKQRRNLQEIDS